MCLVLIIHLQLQATSGLTVLPGTIIEVETKQLSSFLPLLLSPPPLSCSPLPPQPLPYTNDPLEWTIKVSEGLYTKMSRFVHTRRFFLLFRRMKNTTKLALQPRQLTQAIGFSKLYTFELISGSQFKIIYPILCNPICKSNLYNS